MNFRKIAGPMRIDTASDGNERTYRLAGRPGGRMVKSLQYMVKVLASSSSSAQVGMDVQHGPDGEVYESLKVNIVAYEGFSSTPNLATGAIGASGTNAEIVGEWILPVIKIQHSSQSQAEWAMVEVYEMRKPF